MSRRNDNKLRILRLTLVFAVFFSLCTPVPAAEQACRIAVVKSRDLPEYNASLEGFFEVMKERQFECETASYDLNGRADSMAGMVAEIEAFKPDVILTVGSRATTVAAKRFEGTPVVFAMVLYPMASEFVPSMERPGKNLTGAAMDVSIEQQFRTLLKVVPSLKRIGVLYSLEETSPVIEAARDVAASMDLELLAEPVNAESEVPNALSRLDRRKMDALWSVADGKVFTGPSIRYIIEYVARRGIPFMGPHKGFVRAGALVALTAEYRDNGKQAGELCIRILKGENPAEIAVTTPRIVEMALNLRVARHIKLRIPQSVINEASQLFE